jgi:putative PIN family toxin of toxin-antitoxin system
MRVVVDTNVLLSGLLFPFSAPAQIVRMIADGPIVLCYDARILAEYREVLHRPKFPFSLESVEALLEQITTNGIVVAGVPLTLELSDKDDEPFLEVALAGDAPLITGNLKHYPKRKRQGALVEASADFVKRVRKG